MSLKSSFSDYRNDVLSPDTSKNEITNTQIAFYTGAMICFNLINKGYHQEVVDELRVYFETEAQEVVKPENKIILPN